MGPGAAGPWKWKRGGADSLFSGKGAVPRGPPKGKGAGALWPVNLGGEWTLCSANC